MDALSLVIPIPATFQSLQKYFLRENLNVFFPVPEGLSEKSFSTDAAKEV